MVAQQPVVIVRSDNRKVAPEFLLSCSRARVSLPFGVLTRPNFSFQIDVFTRPILLFPPLVPTRPSFLSPWCSRAPESLLSNCCSLALDFRLSPSPCSRAPCLPLFSSSSWATDYPVFPSVFWRPWFPTSLECSPLLLVLPRAWVSLPRGVPVWPNLSFTVSIPARRIYPFSLRVRACANFTFPWVIFPFLFLFSCARYFPSFFAALFFLAFSRARFSSFLDACHAYFAVYKC